MANRKHKVERVFQLYAYEGYSYREIAKIMSAETDEPWDKNLVHRILKNETYLGKIVWNSKSEEGFITSDNINDLKVIDDNIWSTAEKLRFIKGSHRDQKYYSTPFLLRDKLFCLECQKPMAVKNYGRDNKKNRDRKSVYRCDVPKGTKPHAIIPKEEVEESFYQKLASYSIPEVLEDLWNTYLIELKCTTKKRLEEYQSIKLDLLNNKKEIANVEVLSKDIDKQLNNLKSKLNEEENQAIKDEDKLKELKEQVMDEKMFSEALHAEKANLFHKQQSLLRRKSKLIDNKKHRYRSAVELANALKHFLEVDFKSLPNENKRLMIDILIDKVILEPNVDPPGYTFDICMKKPFIT